MAINVDWATKVINIPQADLTFIGGTIYELDTDQFRKDIKALEASEEGAVFDDIHRHNTEVIIGGVTFARVIEFINGYTITFEDGQYRVRLVGSNNNISDVTNLNLVSILSQNSGGLIVTGVGASDWTANERNQIREALGVDGAKTPSAGGKLHSLVTEFHAYLIESGMSFQEVMRCISAVMAGYVTGGPANPIFSALDDAGTPRVKMTADKDGNRSSVTFSP